MRFSLAKFIRLAALTMIATTVSAAEYTPPDVSKAGFVPDACKLTLATRQKIASELSNAVRNGNTKNQQHLHFGARALGVALRLDSENKGAVVTNSMLRKGQTPRIAAGMKGKDFAALLVKEGAALKGQRGKDNAALFGMLMSLANDIDPQNEDAAFELEMLSNKGAAPNWTAMVGEQKVAAPIEPVAQTPAAGVTQPGPSGTTKDADGRILVNRNMVPGYDRRVREWQRRQASIKGLFVITLPTGIRSGSALDIIATIQPSGGHPNEVKYGFVRPVGKR
jgi:hypothetical protein